MTTKRERKYPRLSQDFSGESVTQQHFRASCDVNNIVAHFTQTGIDPNPEGKAAQKYGFATSKDFTESAFAVAEIRSAFADLPSHVRSLHDNDPARWIESQATPPSEDPPKPSPEASQEASPPEDSTPEKPESSGL